MKDLGSLLEQARDDLLAFVRRHAGRLLRYEDADDLVQGIHLRALERGNDFDYRGREPFFGWLHLLARQHLADRHAHWAALKRRPASLVRLTQAGDAARDSTGPATFADRREQLTRAVKALAFLPARDRDLVNWASEGVALAEQAERLGLSYDATKSAARRALERYRGVFRRLV